jgi:hypothetical protein
VEFRRCPLWVISGHGRMSDQCPLRPRKQTSAERIVMSAKRQKRTCRFEYYLTPRNAKMIESTGVGSPALTSPFFDPHSVPVP